MKRLGKLTCRYDVAAAAVVASMNSGDCSFCTVTCSASECADDSDASRIHWEQGAGSRALAAVDVGFLAAPALL